MRTLKTFDLVRAETEIRRSRFIVSLHRVDCEDAARRFFCEVRKEFGDATHNCTAFIVRTDGNPIERSSDDGEPSGTAGAPMLEALRGAHVVDCAAVVTRYFGGIKLGTGGLVRAYTQAVQTGLDSAQFVRLEEREIWAVALKHGEAGKVEAALRGTGWVLGESTYGTRVVTLRAIIHAADAAKLVAQVESLSRGRARVTCEQTTIAEISQTR
ncbi:MAG: YigZ family protein [Actinomycetaceae bacterium]|nr:YigZ family protein [Actinomycetaceae bacterium]